MPKNKTCNDLVIKLNETRDMIKDMPESERLIFTELSVPRADQTKWERDIMYAYRNACFHLGVEEDDSKK